MTTPRLPWNTLAPQPYQSFYVLTQSLAETTLELNLAQLSNTRVSQSNQSASCLHMHVRTSRIGSEQWKRLTVLSTWRDTTIFTPKEKAALAWAESLTVLGTDHNNRNAEFHALQTYFNEKEIVDLTWVVATINACNRMAVAMDCPIA